MGSKYGVMNEMKRGSKNGVMNEMKRGIGAMGVRSSKEEIKWRFLDCWIR